MADGEQQGTEQQTEGGNESGPMKALRDKLNEVTGERDSLLEFKRTTVATQAGLPKGALGLASKNYEGDWDDPKALRKWAEEVGFKVTDPEGESGGGGDGETQQQEVTAEDRQRDAAQARTQQTMASGSQVDGQEKSNADKANEALAAGNVRDSIRHRTRDVVTIK